MSDREEQAASTALVLPGEYDAAGWLYGYDRWHHWLRSPRRIKLLWQESGSAGASFYYYPHPPEAWKALPRGATYLVIEPDRCVVAADLRNGWTQPVANATFVHAAIYMLIRMAQA